MSRKITATYDGTGNLEDPGHDGSPAGLITAGVPFEVTQERFDELVAQGIELTKTTKAKPAAASTPEA